MTVWIGLTGGIGSGKSQAAAEFLRLGIPVLDADQISRELTAKRGAALPAIRRAFGESVFDGDNLNRSALRQLVFTQSEQKQRLEQIMLPLILAGLQRRQTMFPQNAYGVIEIPLLAEQPVFQSIVGRILLVDADTDICVKRVMLRSGLTEDEVRRIMASQSDRRQRMKIADDVVINNGTPAGLREKIGRLHWFYSRMHIAG
ncbi:MAG: dephospho-CoA kinase [Neisseria sp.]|nr:dephospho-CoA kinase [Neisseria sp.]